MKLYELTDQYQRLIYGIDQPEITSTPEDYQTFLGETIALIKDQITDKIENLGKVILTLRASIDCIESERNRLEERQGILERKVDWLKDYLFREMTAAGIEKVQRPVVTVSLRKSPPSCEVVDIDQIPQTFRRVIPERWEPDKKAIIEQFKASGEIVAGVTIVVDKKTVQIR